MRKLEEKEQANHKKQEPNKFEVLGYKITEADAPYLDLLVGSEVGDDGDCLISLGPMSRNSTK